MNINIQDFLYNGNRTFSTKQTKTKIPDLYENKADYEALLLKYHTEIDALQSMMYAHNRYGLLVVFQAMDAAGKDSAIKAVFSGINPHGVQIFAFKQPSDNELEHDFMWRTTAHLPQRGSIAVFNRSYYEEVLVVKVHQNILTDYQRLPKENTQNMAKVWENRYEDIANMEKYLDRNGIKVIKIHLQVSKKEQAERFLERLEDPSKNWKFAEGDLKEREHWDTYMVAYEDAINATSKQHAPWYVVPADDKKNARLIISEIILSHLKGLDIHFPVIDASKKAEIEKYKVLLKKEL